MLNLYMALGAVGTRYNPLINYKWSTLPVSSDYITDGIELWDDDLAVVGVFDANNYTEKLGNNTYRVVYDGTDIKQVKITGIYDTSSLYMIDIEIITTISGSVKVDTSSSGQAVLLSTGKHYYNPANADASIYRGAKPTDVTFKINSIQKVIQEPNKRYLQTVHIHITLKY